MMNAFERREHARIEQARAGTSAPGARVEEGVDIGPGRKLHDRPGGGQAHELIAGRV